MPILKNLKGLEGLKAEDRSQEEKIEIQNIMHEEKPEYTPQDFEVYGFSNDNIESPVTSIEGIEKKIALEENAYQDALQMYSEALKNNYQGVQDKAVTNIKDIASNVSPYFKKYKDSDYLTLSNDDWVNMTIQYQSILNTKGEQAANNFLNQEIKDNVADNQPWYEQAWNGFLGMGASAAGAIVTTAGMIKGVGDYFDGDYVYNEDMGGWKNFLNSVIDNEWTRLGSDISEYGAFGESLDRAKELGVSHLDIVTTKEQDESILSAATPWEALQSGGFTVASMFTGWGLAKGAGLLFKGGKALASSTKALTNWQKFENAFNKFAIPGMVGTSEGAMEGLNTKKKAMDDGINYLNSLQQEEVSKKVNSILSSMQMIKGPEGEFRYVDAKGNPVDIEALYKQVWDEYSPEYQEALREIEYEATSAGINNFYVNSAINGILNSTLQAGLQAPSVRKSLQESRLLGRFQSPKPKFKIEGTGASTTVTPQISKIRKAWEFVKEPIGEFGEEYAQSVSDATVRGLADYNIHSFIDNKYLGDGSAAVGDSFSGDIGAAWTAFTGSLVDKETIKSGVYGAISSIMGTPSLNVRRAKTGEIGPDGKPKTTLFGRGLNEEGKRESKFEYISRLMPWRSGAVSNYNRIKREEKAAQETANTIQEWLRDPNNKGKFDGLVGTFNWAKSMGTAASTNDEFGYRNSVLGKTINDVFMLQHLEGTEYYNSFINQLSEIANLEKGSDAANKYIKEMRDNVNKDGDSQSDDAILDTLKKNANTMLSTINKIQTESEKVDRLLGNVDEDTKQSLIFGQLMQEDWAKRSTTLNNELGQIKINNSREHSAELNDAQKNVLAEYGSFREAQKELYRNQELESSLKEDIKNLKARKKRLTDKEKATLKDKKIKLKTAQKKLKKLDVLSTIDSETSTVLNESEIMALDPVTRAQMLLKGKKKLYEATHGQGENTTTETRSYYSPEQQAVIDNLIETGTAQDRSFLDKVVDAGRIASSEETFKKQYNAILQDPNSFNNYVYRAKQAAADIATKNKYAAIGSIEDYASFAREMDALYDSSNQREQRLVTRALTNDNNANFQRYKSERKLIEGLYNQIIQDEEFQKLDVNDADMFAHTLTYLSDNGVDLNNMDAVVNSLSETEEDGTLKFYNYVQERNKSVPELEQTAFTSVEEAIQNYKKVFKNYTRDESERASNAQPVVQTETPSTASAPAAPVNPLPGVFGQAARTAEENDARNANAAEVNADLGTSSAPETPVTSNNEEVLNSFELGKKIIRNSSDAYSKEAKDNAEKEIDNLTKNEFENVDELSEALIKRANQLDSDSNEELNKQTADLLRQAAARIKTPAEKTTALEEQGKTPSFFTRGLNNANRQSAGVETNPNAAIIESSNVDYIEKKWGDSPVVRYWKNMGIKEFLKSGKLGHDFRKIPVYFITDDVLAQDIKANMEASGANYTNFDIPIIAVVEDTNGPIIINNIHYQSIGTFPSTNNQKAKGSANVGKIRNLVNNNEHGNLIVDNEGKPLVTSLVSIVAPSMSHNRVNTNVQVLEERTLNDKDKKELEGLTPQERRENPIYKKLKQSFLSKVFSNREADIQKLIKQGKLNDKTRDGKAQLDRMKKDKPFIFLMVDNLKDSFKDLFIRTTPVTESRHMNTGKTLAESSGDVEEFLTFNSRMSSAAKILEDTAKNFFPSEAITLDTDPASGLLYPIGEFEKALNAAGEELTKKMNNHLMLPGTNWKYVIRPTLSMAPDGVNRLFNIILTNGQGENYVLGNIAHGTMSRDTQYTILRNLFIDENNQFRKNGNFDFIKWQVDYPNTNGSIEDVKGNIARAYDDGILDIGNESIEYSPYGIEINSPIKTNGDPRYTPVVANTNNAEPSTPLNAPVHNAGSAVQGNGAIIDSADGTIIETSPKAKGSKVIEEKQGEIDNSEDGKAFLNASQTNTVESYQDYLDNNPNGKYRDAARAGKSLLKEDYKEDSNITEEDLKETLNTAVNRVTSVTKENLNKSPEQTDNLESTEENTNENTQPNTPQEELIDPSMGLEMGEDFMGGLFNNDGMDMSNLGQGTVPQIGSLTWGNWEGFKDDDGNSIDIEFSKEQLSKFYTEEQWNSMPKEQQEHELKCKGFFNM